VRCLIRPRIEFLYVRAELPRPGSSRHFATNTPFAMDIRACRPRQPFAVNCAAKRIVTLCLATHRVLLSYSGLVITTRNLLLRIMVLHTRGRNCIHLKRVERTTGLLFRMRRVGLSPELCRFTGQAQPTRNSSRANHFIETEQSDQSRLVFVCMCKGRAALTCGLLQYKGHE
jgi:hypothetical protein